MVHFWMQWVLCTITATRSILYSGTSCWQLCVHIQCLTAGMHPLCIATSTGSPIIYHLEERDTWKSLWRWFALWVKKGPVGVAWRTAWHTSTVPCHHQWLPCTTLKRGAPKQPLKVVALWIRKGSVGVVLRGVVLFPVDVQMCKDTWLYYTSLNSAWNFIGQFCMNFKGILCVHETLLANFVWISSVYFVCM